MKKIMTYKELKNIFCEHEKQHPVESLIGYIVFKPESFKRDYSLESRTYEVSSGNKAFMPNMGGYSILASAIDGSDSGVRLEQYMAEECGGKNGWVVDYCYIIENTLTSNAEVVKQYKRKAKLLEHKYGDWVKVFKGNTDDRRIVVNSMRVLLDACEVMQNVSNTFIKCAFADRVRETENEMDKIITRFTGMVWNDYDCCWEDKESESK